MFLIVAPHKESRQEFKKHASENGGENTEQNTKDEKRTSYIKWRDKCDSDIS